MSLLLRGPLAALAVAWSLAAMPACGLDTRGLGPELSPEPTSPAAGTGSTTGPPPATPAGPTPDPRDASASYGNDGGLAGQVDGAAPPTGEACDIDKDGHLALGCGGDDCCDVDARVHPGVTGFFDAKHACGGFDYDCSGAELREFPLAACKAAFFKCDGNGFAIDAQCGVQAEFTTCTWSAFSCSESTKLQIQRCR